MPTYVALGDVKLIAPSGHVRPYGLGGFGVAHGKMKFLLDGEDQTAAALLLAGLTEDDLSYAKPTMEAGAGAVLSLGRAYMDIGYRFRKAFNTDIGVNVSGMYFGAGLSY